MASDWADEFAEELENAHWSNRPRLIRERCIPLARYDRLLTLVAKRLGEEARDELLEPKP